MTALAERSDPYPPPPVVMEPWCGEGPPAVDPAGASKYYRARYYDPKIGRFISEDPIGFRGGMNFFAYTLNNPTTFVDPFGLQTWIAPKNPNLGTCLQSLNFAGRMGWLLITGQMPNDDDKMAHCLAHCEITRGCGNASTPVSTGLGLGKERVDEALDTVGFGSGWDDEDVDANNRGLSCPTTTSCELRCSRVRQPVTRVRTW